MGKPNFVFILADDLGWCDLSADGSTFYESPNIDRIAHEGMRFTQGYASCQVCSPSRASILTGQYTPRHGVTDWIGSPVGEAWRDAGRFSMMLPPDYEHGLTKDQITIAQALKDSGYRTFFAGKWHCGDEGAYPEDFGFEINKGGWSVGTPKNGYFAPWENPKLPSGPDGESLPLRLGRETVDFISQTSGTPFLAYLSFYSVHGPIETSKDRWEKYRLKAEQNALDHGAPEIRFIFDRNLPVRQVQDCPIYAGMIEAMDDAVGMVLNALDDLGLSENTVVCFTSDNGGVSSGDSFSSCMLPLRGGKGRQWEGGIREPLYIKYPELVTGGTTNHTPVSGIDIYPTLLELAGVPIPETQIVDGKSVVPLLLGKQSAGLSERDLYWHYPHYGNQGGDPSSIIRSGPWKLIHYYEDGHDELYYLETDPSEQMDVSTDNALKVSELRQRLDIWLRDIDAKFPVPDPLYDADMEQERLHWLEHELMPRLERQHAEYLDPDWEPNADWWGSMVTED